MEKSNELKSQIKIEQIIPYHLRKENIKLLTLVYTTINKKKAQALIKYLSQELPLTKVPISYLEYDSIHHDLIYD
jgi:hypothetical protein